MVALNDTSNVKVYTVNGAVSGSSSSLPDWLTRKRVAKKGKRAIKEHFEGTIDLIQEFQFPEASNKIKTTRDGHHAVATGVYKPQMRCYDLDQLTLKFERHTDAENVDFIILSDDWTKMLHLQADRSVELHTQGGFHYRTRIPRFGRTINYHFPSCDALIGASSREVYRLNLDQGRFLNPLVLEGDGDEGVSGVNAIDINPAHQLFAFGVEGNGSVEFWDPRSRSRVGMLRLPFNQATVNGSIAPYLPGVDDESPSRRLSVTAVASRSDGLSYAVGTSSGHTFLYDIRSPRHFAMKDLGYGLPVKNVCWIEGGSRMAGDGLVLSADKKVIKIWDRNNPEGNFASITPAYDVNHVHHLPGSGLLMLANEGIQMTSYYIPQLGPAPRWCSFLDNVTEEMEDQTVRNVYEDFKFVERDELEKLGLDHLVGTPALKPYMHGYFLSLRLYDAARSISNPFLYEEHRARRVQEKLEKMAESRIRARKHAQAPKVNKVLAQRIEKEQERAKRHEEKKREREKRKQDADEDNEENSQEEQSDVEMEDKGDKKPKKADLLNDPRFSALFENPEFEIDEQSREFGLLNPSLASQKRKPKTAVEEEGEESDRASSSLEGSSSSVIEEGVSEEEDSSDAGDLDQFNPRARSITSKEKEKSTSIFPAASRRPSKQLRMVAAAPQVEGRQGKVRPSMLDKDATFGQRRQGAPSSLKTKWRSSANEAATGRGEMEISWVPRESSGPQDADDLLVPGGRGKSKKDKGKRRVETFGASLERGGNEDQEGKRELPENERHGRRHRRSNIRSGSKNAFRAL
ncbi:ENP2 [Sanghuangporus sanghuang]